MKKFRFIFILFTFIILSGRAFSTELVPTADLLAAYLERDSDLQSAAIDYQKAQLSNSNNQIENGFDITLSTGKMLFRKTADSSNFTVSPSVKATVPQASNLGISLSGDFSITSEKTEAEDLGINLSVDIISASALKRQISLLKSERTVLEAKRKVENLALSKEKEFYESLKSLLSQISSVIAKEQDLYEDKISFEKIKAQGYTKNSSSYRRAELAVMSDEHDIEKLVHSLKSDYRIFYIKCGQRLSLEDDIDFMTLVPSDIPTVEAVDIHSFNPEAFSQTESAVWTNKINSMIREADRNFSLAATSGFTFNNSSTNSNTINLGLSSTIGGVTLSPSVNFPMGTDSFTPAVSLEASVNPNTFRKNAITKETYELEEQQEKMDIRNARISFGDKVSAQELELSNLLWERTTNQENLSLYQSLENDMANWYRQGIVTESEYLSAKVNRQKCFVSQVSNLIEMILYNDTTTALFVSDLRDSPWERELRTPRENHKEAQNEGEKAQGEN